MPRYTVGERLRSRSCTVEVIVVRAPDDQEVSCGGVTLARVGEHGGIFRSAAANVATALGKRYVDEVSGTELLCVVAGPGLLAVGNRPMTIKAAKPLPSSD